MRLDAQRNAAAAGAGRLRVVDDESLAQQARVVVEHDAIEQTKAPRIHYHPRASRSVEHRVVGPRCGFPSENVFESGTAAGSDADPKRVLAALALREHLVDVRRRAIGDPNHRTCTATALISATVTVRKTSKIRAPTRQSGSRTVHVAY